MGSDVKAAAVKAVTDSAGLTDERKAKVKLSTVMYTKSKQHFKEKMKWVCLQESETSSEEVFGEDDEENAGNSVRLKLLLNDNSKLKHALKTTQLISLKYRMLISYLVIRKTQQTH